MWINVDNIFLGTHPRHLEIGFRVWGLVEIFSKIISHFEFFDALM